MQYIEGERYGAFILNSRKQIDEYESTGLLFTHVTTGCQVYHLVNSDAENLFSFIFKTPPTDDKGTAHIIEHSVLSGSESYPIKDPFIALTRGSMNTFLNAMTYPDKTLYPASTIEKKDFFNILDVYGDSVFFPLLRRETFHQEGRRYTLDDSGTLNVDGVVYNEMKGNYSSHDSIVGEWSYRSLFPNSPYRFDSGGDPSAIRDLTYEEFVGFHKRFYHPSNCRIFLYGNIPSEEILIKLDERFLSRFDKTSPDIVIPSQPRWSASMSFDFTSPAAEGDDSTGKSTISVNWLTASVHDPLMVLSLEILTEILLGHSGSPLQKAIVESGLGEDISPVSGLDTHTMELVFSVGLRGTDPERKEDFEKLVESVLRKLVAEGIPGDIVTGALNRVEFRNREIKGGAPFGLRLLGKTVRGWLHDDPPEKTLEFTPWMKKVSEHASRPGYFESIIENLFLANSHRSTVVVTPDPKHDSRELKNYRRWQEQAGDLSADEREVIKTDVSAFEAFQMKPDDPEDMARVPCLELADLPLQVNAIPFSDVALDNRMNLLEHYTNGIVYLEMAYDLQDLPEEVMKTLPLLCRAICSAGLPGVPYDEVAQRLSIHTGGFSAFLESNTAIPPSADSALPEEAAQRSVLFVRVKSLESELPAALDLAFGLMIRAELFDETRMREVLYELRNDFKSQLLPSGHSFALIRAGSLLSPVLATEERWKGITQYLHLNEIADSSRLTALCEKLEAARSSVMQRARLTATLTAEPRFMAEAKSIVSKTIERLPADGSQASTFTLHTINRASTAAFEALETPTSVGYVAQVLRGARYGEREHAAEVVASQLLSTGFLWEEVRMRGGAYGVFANANGGEGLFSFSSYRDPSIIETLDAFRKGLELFASEPLSVSEIEKAIITVVGRECRPLSPAEKSMIAFRRSLYGITDAMRQNKRDDVLSLAPDQIQAAARRLLAELEFASSSVLADPTSVDTAAQHRPVVGANRTSVPI